MLATGVRGFLTGSIDLVARAASRDDMRPVLTGVFVTATGTEMTMVATDSYRLAVKRTELEAPLSGEIEANIPARALRELARTSSGKRSGVSSSPLASSVARSSTLDSSRMLPGQS